MFQVLVDTKLPYHLEAFVDFLLSSHDIRQSVITYEIVVQIFRIPWLSLYFKLVTCYPDVEGGKLMKNIRQ
jgi:hypothetical protein